MAHFAEIDVDNVVVRVIRVNDSDTMDNGVESEQKGIDFCKALLGGNWIQTSYNARIRYNYAGIGFTYDSVNNAFIAPMPTHNPVDSNGVELNGQWRLNSEFKWQFITS